MRILVSHRGYWPAIAGAEQMAVETASALAARGHEVRLTRAATGQPAAPAPSSVEVFAVDSARAQSVACEGWAPDVVHAIDLAEPEFAAAAADLARRQRALFALTPASAPGFWADRERGAAVCAAADVLFFLTAAERRALDGLAPASRSRLIPQAPALRGGGCARRFRARHGVGEELVLFLGRRARSKGYRELLGACSAVWEREPEAVFVFAGAAWDPECEAFFRRHRDPRVLDLGVVSAAAKEDALAACAVLCLPTVEDVSPLVFAEAWSYAKPVLSGPFPGVEEVVRDGGDGLVVAPDSAAIAAALIGLLGDGGRRRRLGRAGREKVAADMSWAAVAAAVESGYRAAAGWPER